MILIEIIKRLIFPPFCPFCMEALPLKISKTSEGRVLHYNILCDKCASDIPDSPLRGLLPANCHCVSCVEYRGEYRHSIINLKQRGKKMQALQLGRLMSKNIKHVYKLNELDAVVPVPMSKERRKKRGFNHAALLAQQVSNELNIPYCDAMYKVRDNSAQHSLNLSQRKLNVKNVYSVKPDIDLTGKRILLIDDVVTTGYTLSDCTRALFEKGAISVHCATVAKTPK